MQLGPPVHVHGVVPLQFTVQSPPVQFVIAQLLALWHARTQSPPGHVMLQSPPVQSSMQSPEP